MAIPLSFAAAGCARAADQLVTVYKAASCTCCEGWVRAMERAGFRTRVQEVEDVSPIWRRYGVRDELSSCHLGVSGQFVFVGHVPPGDIRRFLRERPRALGLTVPGMPVGSPGMEIPNVPAEPFNTLLMLRNGTTRVYASHAVRSSGRP